LRGVLNGGFRKGFDEGEGWEAAARQEREAMRQGFEAVNPLRRATKLMYKPELAQADAPARGIPSQRQQGMVGAGQDRLERINAAAVRRFRPSYSREKMFAALERRERFRALRAKLRRLELVELILGLR
jgi:hypothetical protein